MSPAGIDLTIGRRQRLYAWSEIRRVHITRMDLMRRDFVGLEVFMPDCEICLGLPGDRTGFTIRVGATDEEINEILHAYLPAERIDVDVRGGCPAKREDAERALAEQRKSLRATRTVRRIYLLALAGLTVWAATGADLLSALTFVVLLVAISVVLGATLWFEDRDTHERIAAIEKQIAEFDETAGDD